MKDNASSDLENRLELLKRASIFAELPEEPLTRIAESASIERIKADTMLTVQGERPQYLYVLLEGQVGISALGPDGATSAVDVREPVDLFPLAAVLTDSPHLVSARAISDATVIFIPAANFRELTQCDQRLAFSMLVSLSHQSRDWLRQVKDLKLLSASQRLARYVLSLGRQRGTATPIALPLRKQLLASRLGTTPENLSRAFAVLRDHGMTTRGSLVVITDAKQLAAFAGPDEETGPGLL